MSRVVARCEQAMVHIHLAVIAMEDCPEAPGLKDRLREIWLDLQRIKKAHQKPEKT